MNKRATSVFPFTIWQCLNRIHLFFNKYYLLFVYIFNKDTRQNKVFFLNRKFNYKVSGVLEWKVIGKVTDYGQNVSLFCNVSNCCPEYSGWDMWSPEQRTLIIDVKTAQPNKKYDGRKLKDGYTLIIQNITKEDLNVSYSCVYGGTLGEKKVLLEEDVFICKYNDSISIDRLDVL